MTTSMRISYGAKFDSSYISTKVFLNVRITNFPCNSSKKHIYLAFYNFRALESKFDSYDSCHVTQTKY